MYKRQEENKRSDLAPPPDHPLASGPEGVVSGVTNGNDLHKANDYETMKDGDLMGSMNTHDIADMNQRKPRSLGERARQAMSKKMNIGGKGAVDEDSKKDQ